MSDPYLGPDGVLHNRLGIADADALKSAEADVTGARLIALSLSRIEGDVTEDVAMERLEMPEVVVKGVR